MAPHDAINKMKVPTQASVFFQGIARLLTVGDLSVAGSG
jgi:hypothetical protein